jgi:hypothetical protein
MVWAQTTLGEAIWEPAFVFSAFAFALALALTLLLVIRKWKRERELPRVIANVEAIPSLRVDGSYRAIRIILRNRGGTKTTVEGIILCRRPGWFEFGIIGPLLRLDGVSPWRFNVGFKSRKTVALPVTLDVNGLWESFIPLEPENPDNKEEVIRIEKFNEAVKVLRSGAMRYSIQLSHTNRNLDGWVNLAPY